MKSKKGTSDGHHPTLGAPGGDNHPSRPESKHLSKAEKRSKKDKHRSGGGGSDHHDHHRHEHRDHHHPKKSKQKAAAAAAAAALAAEKSNHASSAAERRSAGDDDNRRPAASADFDENGGGGGSSGFPPSSKRSSSKNGRSSSAAASSSSRARLLRPPPPLDPLSLARGMSSRHLSSKIAHRVAPLPKDQVERDLRHMEAYGNARDGYVQQRFAYENRELVRSGRFGTFAPAPHAGDGEGEHQRNGNNNKNGATAAAASGGGSARPPHSVGSARGHPGSSAFRMPVRIDPEEEKRLSLLRKRIHRSERERERLEREYLSLRAHYVHESRLVRKTREYELGRWELLREATRRRARALAWTRARVAMGRDVEALLRHRGRLAEMVGNGEVAAASSREDAAVGSDPSDEAANLVRVWNDMEGKLREAEMACTDIETPAILSQMVAGAADPTSNGGNAGGGGGPRSPKKGDGDRGKKTGNNVPSAEEAAAGTKNDSGGANGSNNNGSWKSKSSIPEGLEPHVIPWDCMVEPQTPFEVPLLLSCLSSATDKAVGFVTDRTNPTAITWLSSTLPSAASAYSSDAGTLAKLREEARVLEEELGREGDANARLQEQIVASRERSNRMVAMMQLLRSETEAVLERHNLVMETPEARAKSAELHKKLLEEENPSAEGDDEEEEEEGEVDELNQDFSSVEDEIQDDEEEEDRSDDESVGIKEITVDKDSNNVHPGEETDEDDDASEDGSEEEGEIAEGDEEGEERDDEGGLEGEEPRRSKRRPSLAADDEESSSLTPPNGNPSYRKRRRY